MSSNWEKLNEQGNILYSKGLYKEALLCFEKALKDVKMIFGIKHSNYAQVINNKASMYHLLGNFKLAESLYQQSSQIWRITLGEEHPEYAISLNNLAALYEANRMYDKAMPLHNQVLRIFENSLGKEHPYYATSLNNLATVYHSLGKYSNAESSLLEALEIRERVLGKNHPDYSLNLFNLAELYKSIGKYIKAKPVLQEVLEIREKNLGKNHPAYAQTLNSLAELYSKIGENKKVESLLCQSLTTFRKLYGETHPEFLSVLGNIAGLYKITGNYEKAESVYNQVLKITIETLGENHPDYITTINQISDIYRLLGKYEKAELLLTQAMKTGEKSFGKMHISYAFCLNSLATLHISKGEYRKAESLFYQALKIIKTILGKNHDYYAMILNNLAEFYGIIYVYNKAEPLLIEAVEIWKNALGENHPHYAIGLNNLAQFYRSMGFDKRAETILFKALEITKAKYGISHPVCADIINNIAGFYNSKKDIAKAIYFYKESLEIRANSYGKNHHKYVESLVNLASIYMRISDDNKTIFYLNEAVKITENFIDTNHPCYIATIANLARFHYLKGDYKIAESIWFNVLKIEKTIFGTKHPKYVNTLFNLSIIDLLTGYPEKALRKMLEVFEIDDRLVSQISYIGDENRILSFIRHIENKYYILLTNFIQNYSELKKYVKEILNIIFKRKGIVQEILAIRKDYILSTQNLNLMDKFEKLKEKRMQYLQLLLEIDNRVPIDQYQGNINILNREIENLENDLASNVPQMEVEKKLKNIEYKTIANLLPCGTILLEFVWYRPFDFVRNKYLSPQYLVFILFDNPSEDIKLVELGNANEIDKIIEGYRLKIKTGKSNEISDIIIYNKLIKPILEKIGNYRKLIISPDGNISLIPFEVILQPDGKFVVENYDISYLDTGRDLLRFQHSYQSQSIPLILADPDFNLESFFGQTNDLTNTNDFNDKIRNIFQSVNEYSHKEKIYFSRLSGTKEEGESIKALYKDNANIWLGANALEGRLKKIKSPHILHLATHGFFLPRQTENDNEDQGKLTEIDRFWNNKFIRINKFENPLLRSGLVLAGVNSYLNGKILPTDAEDGILTAFDVSGLDLIGTDLTVLSACETGVGEVFVGEGVYGLRRSFFLAGTRSLIISLWEVPDEETKELMINFYSKILKGKNKAIALKEAKIEMINKLRSEGRTPNPYLWGAFIFIGDVR